MSGDETSSSMSANGFWIGFYYRQTILCLPIEIIEHIFTFLKPSDRLCCSLACKLWNKVILQGAFWKDVSLVMHEPLHIPFGIFRSTEKPIQHLTLQVDSMGSIDSLATAFWQNVGKHLVSLRITKSYMQEMDLLGILQLCPGLKVLEIVDCHDMLLTGFHGGMPLEISGKTSSERRIDVEELSLAENRSYLTDSVVRNFLLLSSRLKRLNLAGSEISYHPGILTRFYPRNSDASTHSQFVLTFDRILKHVTHHSATLKCLDLSWTKFNDKSCLALCQVGQLELNELHAQGCDLSDAGVRTLCAWQRSLTYLDLSYSQRITDCTIDCISSNLPKLSFLLLRHCRLVTHQGVSFLKKLPVLRSVDLHNVEGVASEGIENGFLSTTNTVLKRLNLANTSIARETIHQIAVNAPNLTHLDLGYCSAAVDDSGVQVICKTLRCLRSLNLDSCTKVSDSGFLGNSHLDHPYRVSISNLTGLVSLNLFGLPITDECLGVFRFRDFRKLDLSGCWQITDAGLVALSNCNKSLEVLYLSNCGKISDVGLIKLLKQLPRLRELDLKGCAKLTDETLFAVARHCPRVRYLNIQSCRMMKEEVAQQLSIKLKQLYKLCT